MKAAGSGPADGRRPMKAGAETPWGAAQTVHAVSPGITLITTASHGGYLLSAERHAAMPAVLRDIPTWAGGRWYEEDQDWVLVVLAFPGAFAAEAVRAAVRQAGYERDGLAAAGLQAFLASPVSELARSVAERWEREHDGWWEACGMSTRGEGWRVEYRQVGTDGRAARLVEGYPPHLVPALPGVAL